MVMGDYTSNDICSVYNNTIGTANRGNTKGGIGVGPWQAASVTGALNISRNNIVWNGTSTTGVETVGGIGLFNFAGTANIYSNTRIYSNKAKDQPGGIGVKDSNGTISIRNNTVVNNTSIYSNATELTVGIGLMSPNGGASTITGNYVSSCRIGNPLTDTDIGGIGVRGATPASRGVLTSLTVTSNQIRNMLLDTAINSCQDGFGTRNMDYSGATVVIRNNDLRNVQNGIQMRDNIGTSASISLAKTK